MKARKFTVFCLAALLLFTGCQKEKPAVTQPEPPVSSSPEEEQDPNWPAKIRSIVLDEKPEVIISLSPALTEIAYELEQTLSGVSGFCDYPEEVAGLDRFGTADQPDLEALTEEKPDLILSSTPLPESAQTALEDAGAAVLVLPRAADMDAIRDIYIDLATAFYGVIDGPQKADQVYIPLRERYAVLAASAEETGDVSGIWLRAEPLLMATPDTWEGTLLEEVLGVKNDAKEYTHWQYPAEKAVDLYPDVIFFDKTIPVEYFKSTTVYNTTDAYKQNKMYPFDSLPFERQSGRMIDELEQMAKMLAAGPMEPEQAEPAAAQG